jgi:hypothetical protein
MIWLNRYTDTIYCIIRAVVGLMFTCHGGDKKFSVLFVSCFLLVVFYRWSIDSLLKEKFKGATTSLS